MFCQKHGNCVFEGHIACGECGNLFHAEDKSSSRYAPKTCTCGHRLLRAEQAGVKLDLPFTARICCPKCWNEAVDAFNKANSS